MTRPADDRYRYARGQLWLALDELVGPGEARSRLSKAYFEHLHSLHRNNFPEDLYTRYKGFREAVSWVPVENVGEGTFASTIRHMSEEEAVRLAREIVEILYQLEHYD